LGSKLTLHTSHRKLNVSNISAVTELHDIEIGFEIALLTVCQKKILPKKILAEKK